MGGTNLNGSSLLIVGGAGFVGSNLVRRCLDGGCKRILVVDNLLSSERDNLPDESRIEFVQGSISDDQILAQIDDDFDYMFHLSTYHGNQSSIANPLADLDNNLVTTLKLFEHVKDFKRLQRVVYSSTGCALAAKGPGPASAVVEDGPIALDFDSPYQISKIVGEMYCVYYHEAYQLPVVRARFQNAYGPGEVLGAGEWRGTPATVWRNVVPTFIFRSLAQLPLEIHGDGSATRDFIYVEDIVDGLVRCALTPDIEGQVFNLASGVETSVRDLAERILDLTNGSGGLVFVPERSWDRSHARFGSTRKSQDGLGFRAQISIGDGLSRTVDWTVTNKSRIENCIERHREFLRATGQ